MAHEARGNDFVLSQARLPGNLHHYNFHGGHGGIGHQAPIDR
jgi:hypothetical protein